MLLKKEADCVAYLKRSQFDFAKAKQLLDLKAGEKKAWGFFCSFLLLFCCGVFIIQTATAFIIQMFSTILFHIGIITPCMGFPFETLVGAPRRGRESAKPWPRRTDRALEQSRVNTVLGDAQKGIQPSQFHLTVVQTNKKQSYVFVHKVGTYNAESTKKRNQLNRIFFFFLIWCFFMVTPLKKSIKNTTEILSGKLNISSCI